MNIFRVEGTSEAPVIKKPALEGGGWGWGTTPELLGGTARSLQGNETRAEFSSPGSQPFIVTMELNFPFNHRIKHNWISRSLKEV